MLKGFPRAQDRLYLLNNTKDKSGNGTRTVWNNPTGVHQNGTSLQCTIMKHLGDIRWFMNPSSIYDLKSIYRAGVMMGFKAKRGWRTIIGGYGQRYVKYDIMGREIATAACG